ncbi:hypothetical protein BCU24_21635 [Vibrio cyclitrophicus]|uniref:DUF3892 domain-containing protein n=1 Tax=Vibrio cyclitrophicus TaxID=47951 RepID=UPI000C824A92|nr:DUF3892 domain-containing protein [Vibrio cyclitrophicus]PMJ38065.1 hypothetical protein BCU24_21635 [Vibrio cyclitrophicus]
MKVATCVKKDEKGNITNIGFDNSKLTVTYGVAMLMTENGETNLEISETKDGKRYLRQKGDESLSNNLDNLPICS